MFLKLNSVSFFKIKKFLNFFLFTYLAALGLSRVTEDLWSSLRHLNPWCGVGPSLLTRDGTLAPCIGSMESYPLDHQVVPWILYSYSFFFSFKRHLWWYSSEVIFVKYLGFPSSFSSPLQGWDRIAVIGLWDWSLSSNLPKTCKHLLDEEGPSALVQERLLGQPGLKRENLMTSSQPRIPQWRVAPAHCN